MRLQTILFMTSGVLFMLLHYSSTNKIEELYKEIDRLKPYEEMYKVMADSVMECHSKCFRIN